MKLQAVCYWRGSNFKCCLHYYFLFICTLCPIVILPLKNWISCGIFFGARNSYEAHPLAPDPFRLVEMVVVDKCREEFFMPLAKGIGFSTVVLIKFLIGNI